MQGTKRRRGLTDLDVQLSQSTRGPTTSSQTFEFKNSFVSEFEAPTTAEPRAKRRETQAKEKTERAPQRIEARAEKNVRVAEQKEQSPRMTKTSKRKEPTTAKPSSKRVKTSGKEKEEEKGASLSSDKQE